MDVYLIELVRYLAGQSWQIAALTLAVATATLALRHRTAHIRYLLWLLVLAKCLVPPFFAVPLKILPEKEIPAYPAAAPVVESGTIELAAANPAEQIAESPLSQRPNSASARETGAVTAQQPWSLAAWAGLTWMGGAGLFLALNLLRALRGQRWLRRRRVPLPGKMRAEMETLLSACGRSALPPIWIVDGIGQPFVWGLSCGSIYVPASFLRIRDAAQRRHVLAHELSHVRRCDAAVNLLQTIAQGLFWFHPFVWWANRQIRREREKCCDEMAVALLGTPARDYCTAVVETLASAETSGRPVPSLAVAGPARNLEERIRTMLRPGRRFYRRPNGPAVAIVLAAALLTVPTAVVLTKRARAEAQSAEQQAALDEVVAAYQAHREAAPDRHLMVIKNRHNVYVVYQNGAKLYRAKYAFGSPRFGQTIDMEAVASDRTGAGETMESMLAWAQQHTPENVEAYDGTDICGLWTDGYGHFEGGQKRRSPPEDIFMPTLRGIGWPLFGLGNVRLRLIANDRYARDHDLICVEEQHEVTSSRRGVVTESTRFYLNPERHYLCQRKHERDHDYAEQITEYGQTDQGRWYPLRISEFGYRYMGKPMTSEPAQVNVVHLDLDPAFPDDIFSPDALLKRYAELLVKPAPANPAPDSEAQDDSHVRVAGRVQAGATRAPIAGALVRVAAPALDMRYTRMATEQQIYEVRTDADGTFDLSVPVTDEMKDISVDAIAPGYGTAAGSFTAGTDNPMLSRLSLDKAWRNVSSNLTILLSEGLYVAGIVKDAQGQPAAGVQVDATLQFDRGYANIAKTETNAQGRFEIFDFPQRKQPGQTAVLSLNSPKMGTAELRGLYDLTETQRRALEITLAPKSKAAEGASRRSVDTDAGIALPEGWLLEYDDGIRGGGNARTWKGQMADDLASLEVVPTPADTQDTSWREEDHQLEISAMNGEPVGTIQFGRGNEDRQSRLKILKPGRYLLRYRREGGKSADNFRMHSGPFEIDLGKPGMYELRFRPKLGRGRIAGTLGGCYALNFERIGANGPNVMGLYYQNAGRRYVVDGLPPGQYRLSASRQSDGSNIFISRAQVTIAGGDTVTMDMPPPPQGTCSLRGRLLGKPQMYKTGRQVHPQTSGRWFVLLRDPGSGPIVTTPAYQTLTMDSHYVIWSDEIVQETEDTAAYSINGIAPGEYTVTAIESPYYQGYTIERQQSKPLILKAGEDAILDFDLRLPTVP